MAYLFTAPDAGASGDSAEQRRRSVSVIIIFRSKRSERVGDGRGGRKRRERRHARAPQLHATVLFVGQRHTRNLCFYSSTEAFSGVFPTFSFLLLPWFQNIVSTIIIFQNLNIIVYV